MKNRNLIKTFFAAVFAFLLLSPVRAEISYSGSGATREEHPEVLQEYLLIKNALVEDDYAKAKAAAIKMTKNFEDYVKHLSEPRAFVVTLNEFARAKDIKSQRLIFKELSQHIYDSLKDLDYDKTIYWQSCPMAFEGKGANWLSLEEQVKNPFMGQDMSKCGSTIEKI